MDRLAEVTRALAANAERNDRTADFPAEGIRVVHQAGLLTATVARRYGGPGGGLADTARILGALGRGDPSVALISAMTLFTHAAQAAAPTWPDDVYRAALAESAADPVLINALRVEPELGTPARGGLPKTIATNGDQSGWQITGRKIFSTGAEGLRVHGGLGSHRRRRAEGGQLPGQERRARHHHRPYLGPPRPAGEPQRRRDLRLRRRRWPPSSTRGRTRP